MKKLTLLLIYALSTPLHASIEQVKTAFEKGNLPLAKSLLSQQNDNNDQKHLYLALIALGSDKLDEAEKHIEKAIELNATDANVQFSYAEIMAKQAESASIFSLSGYIKKVKKAFTAAVKLEPKNSKYRRALIQFHINTPSMLGGDIYEALKHAQALKAVDTLSGTSALIQVYGKMGNDNKFDNELKTAKLSFANEPELFYQLGLYYQEQESFSEALTYFRNAANMAVATDKQRNAKYSAIFQIGRTSLMIKSNFDEGKKAMAQYLNEAVISSSMPSKDWAKFRLANIVEAQGKESDAISIYKELAQRTVDKDLQKQAKCSGQLILATDLYSSQYFFSDSFGVSPPL